MLTAYCWAVMPEPGGPGGPPQYLADQLTLFQPGRADYPHLLLLAPPMSYLTYGGIQCLRRQEEKVGGPKSAHFCLRLG